MQRAFVNLEFPEHKVWLSYINSAHFPVVPGCGEAAGYGRSENKGYEENVRLITAEWNAGIVSHWPLPWKEGLRV